MTASPAPESVPRSLPLAGAGALVLAVLVVVGLLLAGGARASELGLVALQQAAFVVLPGLALARPLRLPNAPTKVGAAWALGTAGAASTFLVGGAIGARWIVWLVPVLGLAEAIRLVRQRRPLPVPSVAPSVGILVLCGAAASIVWLGLFGPNPLTRDVASVAQYQDLVFHLSLVGEVLHHPWPFADPSVAGEALRYQLLAHLDVAASTYVTGVDAESLLLRFQPVAALVAAGTLAVGIGRSAGLTGPAQLAPAAIVLFAGELDLTNLTSAFGTRAYVREDLLSPTQVVAVPLLLTAVAALVVPGRTPPRSLPVWLLLGFGAMGAKVTVVPVIAAGAAFAWLVARRRAALARAIGPPTAVLLVGAVIAYVVFYAGSSGGGLALGPLAIVGGEGLQRIAGLVLLPLVVLAPAFGVLALLAVRRPSRNDVAVWMPIGMVLAALVPYLLLTQPGKSQIYFLQAGLAAVGPLSGVGLAVGLRRWAPSPAVFLGAVGGLVICLIACSFVSGALGAPPSLLLAAALIASAVLALARRLDGTAAGRAAIVGGVLVCVLSLADPVIDSAPRVAAVASGDRLAQADDRNDHRGMTRGIRQALLWTRRNSDPDDVVAVNNVFLRPGDARYFYYSALSQRRVLLQGWAYSGRAAGSSDPAPFAGVIALNGRVFSAEASGLRAAFRQHVRFVLVDRRYGEPGRPPAGLRPVMRTDAAVVYRIDPPRRTR